MDNIQTTTETTQLQEVQTDSKAHVESQASTNSWKLNPEYHRVSEFLGVDKYERDNYELAKKISFIIDWGKEKIGEDNYVKAMNKLIDLKKELGVNYEGTSLVNTLYQQIRLILDKEMLEKKEMSEREKQLEREIAEKRIKVKLKMEKITPEVDKEEIDKKVQKGMKDIDKQIKKRVKSHISKTVNSAIREALQRAAQFQ